MRIWRKTNAERQALRGCCGGLVDRKVHSKKVHSQRMETFKMAWRSYSNMYRKRYKHKRSYLVKVSLHAMYARHAQDIWNYVCLDRHGGAC